MRADNTAHLNAAARRRHDDTMGRARQAIERLDRQGQPVNFTTVAAAGHVSRTWLYTQPGLRAEIDKLRTGPATNSPRPPAAQRATPDSLRERLDTIRAEANRLRAENQQLRDLLARRLAEQRANPE